LAGIVIAISFDSTQIAQFGFIRQRSDFLTLHILILVGFWPEIGGGQELDIQPHTQRIRSVEAGIPPADRVPADEPRLEL